MRPRRRTRRTVPAPIRCPRPAQLPLDPGNTPGPVLCGEPAINSAGPPPGGGRPGDRGWIHFLVTMRRCQHSNVPGVTTRCTRKPVASTPGQRREHGPIGPLEPRPGIHPAQHGDLLAQDQDLGVLRRRRPSQQRQPRQHRDTKPVDQTNQHNAPPSQDQAGRQVADVPQALGCPSMQWA